MFEAQNRSDLKMKMKVMGYFFYRKEFRMRQTAVLGFLDINNVKNNLPHFCTVLAINVLNQNSNR